MASVNITEILGSDSISGSRNTINSNFIILQNWVNQYSSNFGIDLNNGIIDLSSTSTGRISAKLGKFNQLSIPSSGTVTASINSSGVGTFSSLVTSNLSSSGSVTFSGSSTVTGSLTISAGATGTFNGEANFNGKLKLGPAGSIVNTSTLINSGLTGGQDFPDTDSSTFPHGGGIVTSSASPYVVTGTENIIYADLGTTGGFYMSVGDGATVSNLSKGLLVTIINTNSSGGNIKTGVQGSFYTGFNTSTSQGGFPSSGITFDSGKAYRSSINLMWEPRIDQSSATQKGSWVLLSSSNVTV